MPGRLTELAIVFGRLGATAFGGPAAHVALMREEVVRRRGWLDDAHFLDLLGATNLIPGPNSTELAIHIGFMRGVWPGQVPHAERRAAGSEMRCLHGDKLRGSTLHGGVAGELPLSCLANRLLALAAIVS